MLTTCRTFVSYDFKYTDIIATRNNNVLLCCQQFNGKIAASKTITSYCRDNMTVLCNPINYCQHNDNSINFESLAFAGKLLSKVYSHIVKESICQQVQTQLL